MLLKHGSKLPWISKVLIVYVVTRVWYSCTLHLQASVRYGFQEKSISNVILSVSTDFVNFFNVAKYGLVD
jgi:hypothetical protein